ncbi:helix-turn-helix domain-containing protein [Exilibacterium tricleocarpae]|nr:helix-turn-helix transcriptional regulator [Exilibacterium tricleocarpae]
MQKDFMKNLALLCSYYNSVSEVCRRTHIHRSQFNKYLNGESFPARHTLRKICDFFGVEDHEILSPTDQLKKILRVSPRNASENSSPVYVEHIAYLRHISADILARYAGFYFEYYYSMTYPDSILRALVHLRWDGEAAYFTRTERLTRQGSSEHSFRCRYKGMAFYLADRLFLQDYESLTQNEICQTVLFPSYKSRTTYLTGLKLGVAAQSRRPPTCTRVVYEFLGRDVNVKPVLRRCGLFDNASTDIAADIKSLIDNAILQGDRHFSALAL